ncbi:MAG TPA: class I SAM-dependent methyltransferase [Acidobacteriota bacterium]|nr:class I SAM-dependent methyltransferase [Acidobacteriota bacterium]
MRRTLEKLAEERRTKDEDLARSAASLKAGAFRELEAGSARLVDAVAALEKAARSLHALPEQGKSVFGLKRGGVPAADFGLAVSAVRELSSVLEAHVRATQEAVSGLLDLAGKQSALGEARDREYDALGSNHVGMIFKSMEWRVEKLAAAYEDVQILMKKFLLLEKKLDALLATLEKAEPPAPSDVRPLLEPLKDWRYAGFENRFRGSEEDIRKQQAEYASLFPKGGKVLDLGCGRGEFLDLLRDRGLEGAGVDLNGAMIDACVDKGLDCRQGDILERLADAPDGSLGGVFSSQVVEHLPPAYLRKLVETAFAKLAPGGRIVLETVNPTSVFALVQIYFLDMSHEKPVHPQALKFLLESAGFAEVEVRYSAPLGEERLRELPGADERTAALNADIDKLNALLYAPPNYAVMGKKP